VILKINRNDAAGFQWRNDSMAQSLND